MRRRWPRRRRQRGDEEWLFVAVETVDRHLQAPAVVVVFHIYMAGPGDSFVQLAS